MVEVPCYMVDVTTHVLHVTKVSSRLTKASAATFREGERLLEESGGGRGVAFDQTSMWLRRTHGNENSDGYRLFSC